MSTSEDRSGLINLFDKLQPLAFGLAYSRNVVKVRDRLLQRLAVEVGDGALLRYPRTDLSPSDFVIAGDYLYVQLRPQLKSADVEFRVDIVNRDEYKYTVYFSTCVSSVRLQPPRAATLPLPPLSPDTWYTVAIDLPAALHTVSRGRDGPGSYGWVCGVQLGPAALYRGVFHAASRKEKAAHTPVSGPHHTWPAVLQLTGYAADAPVLLWCPAVPKRREPAVGPGRSRTAADDALTSRAHSIIPSLPHIQQQLRVRPSSAKSLASSGSGLSEEAKHSARARSPYSQGNSPKHHENAAVAAARHRDLELANMAVAVRSIREGSFSGTLPTSPARPSSTGQRVHADRDRDRDRDRQVVPAGTPRVSSEEEPGAGSALLAARAAAMQADDIWAEAADEEGGGVGEGGEGEEQAAEEQPQEGGQADDAEQRGEEHATAHEDRTVQQSIRSGHDQDGPLPDLLDQLASLRAHTQAGTGTGARLKMDRTTGLALQAVARVGGASPVVWIPSTCDPLLQSMRPAQLVYPVDCSLCGLEVHVQDNDRGVPCGPPYSGAQAYYPGSPHTGPISSVVASPCLSLLATASIAAGAKRTSPDPHAVTVCIWDRVRRVVLATLTSETHGLADGLQPPAWAPPSHSSPALSLSFSMDSTLLAVAGRDERGRSLVTVLDVSQLVRDTQERQQAGEARGGDTSALDITLASTAGWQAQAQARARGEGGQPHPRGGPGVTRLWVPKQEGGLGLYPLLPVQATLPGGALIVARQVVEGSSSSHLLKCAFSPYTSRALWTLCDGGGHAGAAALHVWTVQAGRMLGKAIPLDRALVSAGVLFTDFAFEGGVTGCGGPGGALPGGVLDVQAIRGRRDEEDAPALASTGPILPDPQPQAELTADASRESEGRAGGTGREGPRVYISTSGGTLIQLGYDRREVQGVHVLHDGCIAGVSVGTRHVCTVGWEDGLVRVWPSSGTQGLGSFIMEAAHEGHAISVAMSPSERLVAVLSSTRGLGGREEAAVASLGILDVAAQRYKVVARGHGGTILAVCARPSPAVQPGEDSGNAVDLYDQLHALHAATLPVVTLASDRTIRVWHADSPTPSSSTTRGAWKQAYHFHTGELEASCVAYHPMLGHRSRLLACRELLYLSKAAGKRARQQVPGTVEASMMQEVAEAAEREYHEGLHAALDACNTLFLGFTDGSVRVLHVPSQAVHASFTTAHARGARVTHCACSEDGQVAFSAALDGVLAQYTSSLSPPSVGEEQGPLGTARRGHTWALSRTFSWGLPRGVYARSVSMALESTTGLVAFSCSGGDEASPGLPPGSLCAVLAAYTLTPLGRGVLPLQEAQAKPTAVRTWDKASGRAVKVYPSPYALSMGEATCLALLPVPHADRRRPGVREVLLAAGTSDGQLFMWAVGTERRLQASRQSYSWRPSLDTRTGPPTQAGWDLPLLLSVQLHAAPVTSMQCVPASGLLVTTGGGSERMLRCWDAHALCEHALLQGQLQEACAQAEGEGDLQAVVDLLEACQAVQHTPLASRASQGGSSTARRGFSTLACIPLRSSHASPAGTTMHGPAEQRKRDADSTLLLTAQAGASSWFSLLL